MDMLDMLPVFLVIAVIFGGLWIVLTSKVNDLPDDQYHHAPDAWPKEDL